MAFLAASTALLGPLATPIPNKAVPLFFITVYQMLTRKERTWAKTVHTGDDEMDGIVNEDIPIGEIEGK